MAFALNTILTTAFCCTAVPALACTPIAEADMPPPVAATIRGSNCEMTYTTTDGRTIQRDWVERINTRITRQRIGLERVCEQPDAVIVYYDCTAKEAIWFEDNPNFREKMTAAERSKEMSWMTPFGMLGSAAIFVETYDGGFNEATSLEDIARTAASLPWMAPVNHVAGSNLVVETKPFGLGCGCRMAVRAPQAEQR